VIVLTASEGSFPGLSDALTSKDLTVLERPLIGFTAPEDWTPLDHALERLDGYQAIAFTSPRAGNAVVERARFRGIAAAPRRPTVWATGAATASALQDWLGPVRVPTTATRSEEGAAAALARAMLAETRGPVLFPCGEARRDELPMILRESGVQVDEVVCYRTVLSSVAEAKAAAASGAVLMVASPSVMGLLARACRPGDRPRLFTIGPTTAAAARNAGWIPSAVADEPTLRGVLGAIDGLLTAR
jgi:uroporphyrinogen III methyltransferase / synthase